MHEQTRIDASDRDDGQGFQAMASSESPAEGCSRLRRRQIVAGGQRTALAAGPDGQLTWEVHISLAPTWFDPAETPGIITPFMILYALHDAMVKPMPGNAAESRLA